MEFNVGKCSILNVGRNNPSHNYCLHDTPISSSGSDRDLGVLMSSDLSPIVQCFQVRNPANRNEVHFKERTTLKRAEVILKLFLALVRPHHDYVVQF